MRTSNIFFAFGLLALATPATTAPAGQTAGRLPAGVTPLHYTISIRPDAKAMTFRGFTSIRINVAQPTNTITLNAADLSISSAKLDSLPGRVTLNAKAQTVTVRFAKPVTAGEHALDFTYAGKIYNSASGLFAVDYKNADGTDARMLVTQFEAPDARRFAPMWDEPAHKATFTLSAFAPKGETAFSNMPATSKTETKDGTLYTFARTPKMSSYLLFLGMGDVERKTKKVGKVEVGVITRRGVLDQGDYALNAAADMITYYNDYFGVPYPLPKLDMIAAPGSSQFFGAMENWGAILYFERRVLVDPKLSSENQKQDVFATVSHEIAHQWFGNIVTMAWWDDLWLNEGYASWMQGKNTHDANPGWQVPEQIVAGDRQGAMALDARETTHPIIQRISTVDQISQAFDSITYQKGQAVIGMLEAWLGADTFKRGVRNYMRKYAYQNTVTDQLWREMALVSGKPVASVMAGFTKQPGVPMIKMSTPECVAGQTRFTLSQERFALDAGSRKPQTWQVPVTVGIAGGASKKLIVSGSKALPVTLAGCGLAVANQGQTGYFRTLYTPDHFAKLKAGFSALAVADQVGIIADSYALANGDYADIAQHLALVETLPVEASPIIWSQIAGQLTGLDSRLEGSPDRAAYQAKAASVLAPVFARVGWEAKAGEPSTVAQLREALLPAMAELGDKGVVAQAKTYVEKSFADADSVPSDIRLIALRAYGANADVAGWELLHAKAKAENNPTFKSILYRALASNKTQSLAERALKIALSDEVPVPMRSSIIAAASQEHPAFVFDWAVANKDVVNGMLEESSKSEFIVGLAYNSTDLALADRVMAYANANIPAPARMPALQTVGFIKYLADRKAKQGPALIAWAKGN